jgi:hypothetical protein
MRSKHVALAALVLASSVLTRAQTQPQDSQGPDRVPLQFAGLLQAPDVPGSAAGWLVQIASKGGIGGGVTVLTVASSGTVTCSGLECRSQIGGVELASLSRLIAQDWSRVAASPTSLCSDCIRTLIVVKQRDERGGLRQRIAYWDVTSRSGVPEEINRLFDEVTARVKPEAR